MEHSLVHIFAKFSFNDHTIAVIGSLEKGIIGLGEENIG
jgi:hypothetical protein